MKVLSSFLAAFVLSVYSYASTGKIIISETNKANLQLDSHEIAEFFEPFFAKTVSKWSGGKNPIGEYGLKINIFATTNPQVQSNAQFARGGLSLIIGGDVKATQAKKVLQNMVAHELGHVVFEKFSGLGSYAQTSIFGDLAGFEASRDHAFLALCINELFADVVSFYLTGISDDNVLLRGQLFDFSRKVTVHDSGFNPNDPYHFFLPSRKSVYDQFTKSQGDFDDLGRYYSLFVSTLKNLAKSGEIKNLDSLEVVKKINDRFSKNLANLSSYPLAHELER